MMDLIEIEKVRILNNFLTLFHTYSIRKEYNSSQYNNIMLLDLFRFATTLIKT